MLARQFVSVSAAFPRANPPNLLHALGKEFFSAFLEEVWWLRSRKEPGCFLDASGRNCPLACGLVAQAG